MNIVNDSEQLPDWINKYNQTCKELFKLLDPNILEKKESCNNIQKFMWIIFELLIDKELSTQFKSVRDVITKYDYFNEKYSEILDEIKHQSVIEKDIEKLINIVKLIYRKYKQIQYRSNILL